MVQVSAISADGSASGAKAQNADFLASDISYTDTREVTVTVSMLADALEVTFNGTDFFKLGTPSANTVTQYKFNVRNGDTVNFRTPDAGGTTLDIFRVDSRLV